MTVQDMPPIISIDEASALLGVSRRSAYRAATNGEIPSLRLGRRVLVPTARLLDLLGLPADALKTQATSSRP